MVTAMLGSDDSTRTRHRPPGSLPRMTRKPRMRHWYSRNGINASCVRCGKPEKHPDHTRHPRKRVPGQWSRWFNRSWKVW